MRFLLGFAVLGIVWTALSWLRWRVMARHFERRFRMIYWNEWGHIWDMLRFAPHPFMCRVALWVTIIITLCLVVREVISQ